MRTSAITGIRGAATCASGHQVEIVDTIGVVRTIVHRYPATADPISGRLREVRCPACEETVRMLARPRVRDHVGGGSYVAPGLRRVGTDDAPRPNIHR
jgi:hypothetical protein